jgi:tRNA 2-thiocytidine biosynthesis protein TtcA
MQEILFLNMFYTGRLKSMPQKPTNDDGKHIVIRPLAYCAGQDLADYALAKAFPGRMETMFSVLQNVVPFHLADPKAFNFVDLATQSTEYAGADQAFDPIDLTASSTARTVTELVTITHIK